MDSVSETRKMNRIKILTQHALLKHGFENLHHVNTNEASLKFSKTGFTITCATSIQQPTKKTKNTAPMRTSRTQSVFEFYGDKLYSYDYRLLNESGVMIP